MNNGLRTRAHPGALSNSARASRRAFGAVLIFAPVRVNAYFPPMPKNNIPAGYEGDRDPRITNPNAQQNYYQRYNFTGVVIYPRDAFAGLGAQATGADRQSWLREHGRAYMTHRFSGGLLSGAQGRQ